MLLEPRLRVFVAVRVSNPDVLARIKNLQEELERAGLRAKMVEPENMHITLQFIGEIPREKVIAVQRNLENVKAAPFKITFEGVGCFPNMKTPRVVWVGVSKGGDDITKLAEKVHRAVSSAGVRVELEDFKPHLTVARVKAPINSEVRRVLESHSGTFFGEEDVTRFYLVKSTLTPSGPIYTDLAEYALA